MPVGGAEDLVAAIVRGLDPRRFSAAVATLGPPGPVGHELRAQGYEVISLGLDIKRTSVWRVAGAVRRLLKAQRPDILHTHLYHPNLYGRLGALGLGLSGVVAAVHNSYTRVKFHRRLWNFLLGWATDRVLVGSPQVWQDVRRYDGVPASRLLLLPYGIPLGELETPSEPGGGPGTVGSKGSGHRGRGPAGRPERPYPPVGGAAGGAPGDSRSGRAAGGGRPAAGRFTAPGPGLGP